MTRITTLGQLKDALTELEKEREQVKSWTSIAQYERECGNPARQANAEAEIKRAGQRAQEIRSREIGWPYAGVVVAPD